MSRKLATRTALASAAASEDRLKLLRELRASLVEAYEGATCVRDKEPLARRIAAIACEIDELAGQREPTGGPVEEILRRRAACQAAGLPVTPARTGDRGERTHG